MARVTVHNISDRPNAANDPLALFVGGQRVRPGKSIQVDDSALNGGHWAMVGKRLWVGDLPERFRQAPRGGLTLAEVRGDAAPLDLAEARAKLDSMDLDALLELAQSMSPPVDFPPAVPKAAVVSRLSRALFQVERELDPETFFWLGRWVREGDDFVPRE